MFPLRFYHCCFTWGVTFDSFRCAAPSPERCILQKCVLEVRCRHHEEIWEAVRGLQWGRIPTARAPEGLVRVPGRYHSIFWRWRRRTTEETRRTETVGSYLFHRSFLSQVNSRPGFRRSESVVTDTTSESGLSDDDRTTPSGSTTGKVRQNKSK